MCQNRVLEKYVSVFDWLSSYNSFDKNKTQKTNWLTLCFLKNEKKKNQTSFILSHSMASPEERLPTNWV